MAYKRTESKEDIKERVRARGKKFVSYKEVVDYIRDWYETTF